MSPGGQPIAASSSRQIGGHDAHSAFGKTCRKCIKIAAVARNAVDAEHHLCRVDGSPIGKRQPIKAVRTEYRQFLEAWLHVVAYAGACDA